MEAPGPKERINHVLEQLGFKPFPAWLDEALLPSYGLRNLEKKSAFRSVFRFRLGTGKI